MQHNKLSQGKESSNKSEEFKKGKILWTKATGDFYKGKLEDSLSEINESIRIIPHPASYALRANIYLQQNKIDEALEDIKNAETIATTYGIIYEVKSKILEKIGNKDEAYLNKLKGLTMLDLEQDGKVLNENICGLSMSGFSSSSGEIGYVQSGLDLKMSNNHNEYKFTPLPKKGISKNMIFKNIKINQAGTIVLNDNLSFDKKYKINSYRLLTMFLDSSRTFYQLYYEVKYEEIK